MKISVLPALGSDTTLPADEWNMNWLDMDQPQKRDDEEVFYVYTRSKMFQAMKPLFNSLQVFGLYHGKLYTCSSIKDCNMQVRVRKCGMKRVIERRETGITLPMVYSWVIFMVCFANYLRHFWMFSDSEFSFGPEFFIQCSLILWQCNVVVNFVTCYRASHRYDGIPKFFVEWESLVRSVPGLDIGDKATRRFTNVIVALTWLVVAINSCVMAYCALVLPDIVEPLFSPVHVDDPNFVIMKWIFVVLQPLLHSVWSFGMAVDFVFCYILYKLFQKWHERFVAKCSAGITSAEFAEEQLNHQKICRLVSSVEDFLSLYKAMSFVSNIAIILFLLYNFVYLSSLPASYRNPTVIASNVGWIFVALVALSVTCVSGVMVNSMAHSVFDDVELQMKVDVPQIQLFLTRLSGNSIGMTALGMFVFDKSSIMTTLGMLLSYFIVMLQFNPGSSSVTACVCNCTSGYSP